ncbi:hypothetical protein EVAR_8923_1 [Eumeta japonica]|uniref:Uncharacterized protein n=1 Tax=Eumeta variegata TaxID=151549 RepID=A0A4C1U0A0_EUMVA|nr:hypothetical protein EVAR_8923_1 [Eumeta japonica]
MNVAVPFVEGDKFIVKNCVPKGIVRLRNRIPKPHFVQDSNVDNIPGSIPLPETKLRHPLFGFDYKSYLKLPSYVTDKLQNLGSSSSESYIGINRKKKKKKIKIEIEEQPVRINKKRKMDDDSDTNAVKSKRKKHNISAEEMWESEKAIEENLFNL